LSLQIYLDDCAYDKILAKLLQDAGHSVTTPYDASIDGQDDQIHFDRALRERWVLLTKNPRDFEELHKANRGHAGILAIYQDNDPSRDMAYADIVRAVANLEGAGVPLAGEFHILNCWRY
jgi:hypothetical protein